jgi:ferredoxin
MSFLQPDATKRRVLTIGQVVPAQARCVQCGICSFNCPIGIDVRNHAWRGVLRFEQTALNCRACHSEHRGPTAPLTELNLKGFPLDQFGFALNTHLNNSDGSPLGGGDD